jgi:hypothetical protein
MIHSNLNVECVHDYFEKQSGMSCHEYNSGIRRERFSMNYVDFFIENSLKESVNYSKTICLFGASTREMANISYEGTVNIINVAKKINIFTFICGTSIFNNYNIYGVDWNRINNIDYGKGTCNVVGTGWEKTLKLMMSVNGVVSGPTGICMIPPMFNKKLIWIEGGDSKIMEGCLAGFTTQKEVFGIKCNCPNYPCNSNVPGKIVDKKYFQCLSSKLPDCLNNNINIKHLEQIMNEL